MMVHSPVRILLLTEGFPPDNGGVATSALRIAENLSTLNAEVTVLCYLRGDLTNLNQTPEVSHLNGIKVVRIGPFFKAAGTDFDTTPNANHRALMRRRFVDNAITFVQDHGINPNIIFSMYLMNAGFLATHISSILNVPHVAGVRGNDIGRNLFDPTTLYCTRFILEKAARVVVVNQHLLQRMLNSFPDLLSKSLVINNSIHPKLTLERNLCRQDLLRRTGWATNALVCCFIGNMREKKGSLELIDAITQIHKSGSAARFLLISPALGPTEQILLGQQLSDLVAKGVVFHTGMLSRKEVSSMAAGADIILQPSLEDGMANGLLEGMSLGLCPVVSSIFSDVVQDGIDGVILRRVNPDCICAAIESLYDERKRSILQKAAALRSQDFSPAIEASAYLRLFEETILQTATADAHSISPNF